jgi:hypothetical protein
MRALYFLIALALLAPGVVAADGDDVWTIDCQTLCSGQDNSCGALPCPLTDCMEQCQNAAYGDNNPFDACENEQSCAAWFTCICAALGSPISDDDDDDDSGGPAGSSSNHHHGGCGIVAADPVLALYLVMTTIGFGALIAGRWTKKAR